MVAIDPQYFDIQPQQDNNNILFNDLVNVVPVAHPWTGMGYRERIEVKDGDKQRHWFRKRKGFKKVDLYRWICGNEPELEDLTEEWLDGEFTDETIYEGHRWFLRLNKDRSKAKVYVHWFTNPEECTNGVYAPINTGAIIDVTESFNGSKSDTRRNGYYLDFAPCGFDRFLPTWGLKYNNLESVPDEDPAGDWVVRFLNNGGEGERVLYDKNGEVSITPDTPYIRLNDTGMVVENGGQVCPDVASEYKIPLNAIFVSGSLGEEYLSYENMPRCSVVRGIKDTTYENKISGGITIANAMGSTISFFTTQGIVGISAYGQRPGDEDDFNRCFRTYTFAIPGTSTEGSGSVITSATIYNNRIAFVRDNDTLVIGGTGDNQSRFPFVDYPDINGQYDPIIGVHKIHNGFTDCVSTGSTIVLLGPHKTWYATYNPEANSFGLFEITDRSGYFNKGSWCYKDGRIFIARTYKDLYYLEGTNGYGGWSFNYSYYSQYINSHLRSLHRVHDKINIDMTDNNTYVCIQDNDYDEKYSKILIQDRQYNFWYTWVINGARISRIKDEVHFGDNIYSYEGDTDNGKEIIEIISATWGDETIQATKHFINVKMAVGENSSVGKQTTLETNVTDSGLEQIERLDITPIRYPNLLGKKEPGVVHRYDIGIEISSAGEKDNHTLQNEILRYQNLDTSLILWDEEAERVGTYAPIVYKVNRDGELIKLTAIARGKDNLEFGGFFIGYYQQDYDFGDIAESMVTPSDLTYASEHIGHKMPAVEDPITLGHI